jgi:Permeases
MPQVVTLLKNMEPEEIKSHVRAQHLGVRAAQHYAEVDRRAEEAIAEVDKLEMFRRVDKRRNDGNLRRVVAHHAEHPRRQDGKIRMHVDSLAVGIALGAFLSSIGIGLFASVDFGDVLYAIGVLHGFVAFPAVMLLWMGIVWLRDFARFYGAQDGQQTTKSPRQR